jgi:endonuclease/exonuclease/phosphatase family metal-dependent hydrolase
MPFYLNKLLITRILLLINFLLIISLIFAYLAPYISPAIFWPIAFFGLAFPVIVLANGIISLSWLFVRPRYALFSLMLIIAGINPLLNQYQLGFDKRVADKKGLTIVTFNVHNFSGIHDGSSHHSIQREIFSFIRNHRPQIICLQDLPVYWPDRNLVLSGYARQLSMKSIYTNSTGGNTSGYFNSTALLTNYPLIDSGELSIKNHHAFAVFNDLLIGNDTVRVYSVHLASIKLYGEMNILTAQGLVQSRKRGIPRQIVRVIKKLRSAFISRADQAGILEANILASQYPVIVCGDFNDTPLSYTIHKIRHGLKDSFIEKGHGFGRTYIGSNVPLRIDNVFADPSFIFYKHEAVNNCLSDHLPVVTNLGLENRPLPNMGK